MHGRGRPSSCGPEGLRSHTLCRAKVAVSNSVGCVQRVVIAKPSPPQLDMRVINSNSICVSWKQSESIEVVGLQLW